MEENKLPGQLRAYICIFMTLLSYSRTNPKIQMHAGVVTKGKNRTKIKRNLIQSKIVIKVTVTRLFFSESESDDQKFEPEKFCVFKD